MNRQVRQNCWETNSSSSHSLTIVSGNYKIPKLSRLTSQNDPYEVVLTGGQFGWGIDNFSDFDTKLRYAYTSATGYDGEDNNPKTNNELAMLCDVITEYFPEWSSKHYFKFTTGDYYIDHQSTHLKDELFQSKRTLRNFLFCSKSILHISNDNI